MLIVWLVCFVLKLDSFCKFMLFCFEVFQLRPSTHNIVMAVNQSG